MTPSTTTVTTVGYLPPGQQIYSRPGPARTKGEGEKIRVRTNLGGTTPDGDWATSPTRSTTTNTPTSIATSQEWVGGGATKVQCKTRGSPTTNRDRGPTRDRRGQSQHDSRQLQNHHEDTVIGRELNWQSRVEGDQAKGNAFCNQEVNQTTCRAFAFMKGHSPVVHMAHLIGQFFGMLGLAAKSRANTSGLLGTKATANTPSFSSSSRKTCGRGRESSTSKRETN